MVESIKVRRAFTLVELLVVIGIIALLVGILIPVISKVRTSAYVADTRNWLVQIDGAIVRYHNDFHAYPGPISNGNIDDPTFVGAPAPVAVATSDAPGFDVAIDTKKITMSENLVLGLLGGVSFKGTTIVYNPSQVGLGPMNLNPANPKRYPAYLEGTNLSWKTVGATKTGHFFDDALPAGADDTIIPEFVDRFPDAMPLLYLRSKIGVDVIPTASATAASNSVITNNSGSPPPRPGAYDISQIIGYTSRNIGTGKSISASDYKNATYPAHGLQTVNPMRVLDKSNASNYQYPYDAFPYFQSPNSPNVPRQKDSYILISPGKDRVYGTSDDICNFGEVNP